MVVRPEKAMRVTGERKALRIITGSSDFLLVFTEGFGRQFVVAYRRQVS